MSREFEAIFANDVAKDINGVINTDNPNTLLEEFGEFVVTDEIALNLEAFFDKYNAPAPACNGAWISGFFGCGKSHLLKILSCLIENRKIGGQDALLYFDGKLRDNRLLFGQMSKAASIPSESVLFNIVQYNQNDKNEPILHIFQRKFDEHCGYYGVNPKIAALERDLDKSGLLQKFRQTFERGCGKRWEDARKQPHINKGHITRAFAEATGNSEDASLLEGYGAEISIHDFAEQVREYIAAKPAGFRLNFFVDEVGQFVARSSRLMVDLQEIATTLSSATGNRSWLVVTSQDELDKFVEKLDRQDKTDISKIMGRFKVKMSLSNANVNEVIQKRLLEKSEEGKAKVGAAYDIQKENFNTLFQFANGPKKFRVYKDRDEFVSTYPFVVYQFDMFKATLESLSAHNAFPGSYTSTGARSMLDVFHKVLRTFAASEEAKVGASLIPYDAMYGGLKDLLKENFKRSVDIAENNIVDSPLALRALKALLLVKYLKRDFKATARNLAILLLKGFDENPADIAEEAQAALDRLARETYIQRSGDEYDFLTNEEKDVEEEIRQTVVQPNELADEVRAVVYDNILAGLTKAQDARGIVGFQFARKIDGEAVAARHSEISVNILTPFAGSDSYPQYRDTLDSPDTELVMLLGPNRRLAEDFLLYIKTEKFAKLHAGDAISEDREKVLQAKVEQNRARRTEIQKQAAALMEAAPLFIAGIELDVARSANIAARAKRGLELLIDRVYPNLKMINEKTASEAAAKALLGEPPESALFANELAEAELHVLNELRACKERRGTATIASLLEKFRKRPYGWPAAALIYNVILLVRKSLASIKLDAVVVEDAEELRKSLFSAKVYDHIVIELCQDVSPAQVKRLKRFIYDFAGLKCECDAAKDVARMAEAAIRDAHGKIREAADALDFPFAQSIRKKLIPLEQALGKSYTWFFSDEFEAIGGKIIEANEEHFEAFLGFAANKAAIAQCEEARDVMARYAMIREQLDGELWDKIAAIIDDEELYKKSGERERLQGLVASLRQNVSSIIMRAKESLEDEFEEYAAQVREEGAFGLLAHEQREHVDALLRAESSKIDALSSIEEISNARTFGIPQTKAEIKALLNSPSNGEEGEGAAKEKKALLSAAVAEARPAFPLKTEGDVDAFIGELKKALLEKIRDGWMLV